MPLRYPYEIVKRDHYALVPPVEIDRPFSSCTTSDTPLRIMYCTYTCSWCITKWQIRVPVKIVLVDIAQGMSVQEISEEYDLTEQQIKNALTYAAALVP